MVLSDLSLLFTKTRRSFQFQRFLLRCLVTNKQGRTRSEWECSDSQDQRLVLSTPRSTTQKSPKWSLQQKQVRLQDPAICLKSWVFHIFVVKISEFGDGDLVKNVPELSGEERVPISVFQTFHIWSIKNYTNNIKHLATTLFELNLETKENLNAVNHL